MSDFFSKSKLIMGFVALNITSGTAGGILMMIVPLYAISLNASTAEIGLIKGISGLGLLLLVLPAGFLVDHYGSKKLYIVGGFLSGLITFTLPFVTMPLFLIVAMAIHGFVNSLKFTSLNAAFFKYLNTMGLEKAGWYKGSMSIGLTFIGPLLGAYLVQLISFKLTFIIVGLITVIPTILILLTSEKGQPSKAFDFKTIFKDQLIEFKVILRNKIIKHTVLIESLSTACFSCFATFIVVLIVRNYHLPAKYASLLITLEGGAFVLTAFLAGSLLNKFKISTLYLGSFLLTIFGLLGVSFVDNIRLLWLSTIITGFGLGMVNLITYSQIGKINGEKGKIAGLLASCTGLGATFGPIIGGIIGQKFGIQAIFLSFIPAFILLGVYIGANKFLVEEESPIESVSYQN